MNNTRHINLVRIYGYFYDETKIYIVMEYCPGGELLDHLRHEKRFNKKKTALYVIHLTKALSYMHEKNCIHRDIKPENLLIDIKGNIKLSDFGWSVHGTTKQKRQTLCGTVEYLPPEMLERNSHGYEVDFWAIGVLTYELLSGNSPFESDNNNKIFKRIKEVDLKFPVYFSEDSRNFSNITYKLSTTTFL